MTTMQSARWHKAKDIRVEEMTVPQVTGPYDVKVKVKFTEICDSDLHEYAAGSIFIPIEKPHLISGDVAPIVMGHE